MSEREREKRRRDREVELVVQREVPVAEWLRYDLAGGDFKAPLARRNAD